eukprot:m.212919 g.212919  ORF g.212919 m.212919 type:complete len:51 (+) comp39780_c0_seq4:121-273(+)
MDGIYTSSSEGQGYNKGKTETLILIIMNATNHAQNGSDAQVGRADSSDNH